MYYLRLFTFTCDAIGSFMDRKSLFVAEIVETYKSRFQLIVNYGLCRICVLILCSRCLINVLFRAANKLCKRYARRINLT